MKRRKKPFIRYIQLDHPDGGVIEVFNELGYIIYEDPTQDGNLVFISNVVLTYGWLKRNLQKYGISKKWFKSTKLADMPNNETLDEVTA